MKTLNVKGFRVGSVRFERAPYNKPGWEFVLQVGPGAGYRWIDLPGHSMNIADGWRCRKLSISGRTLRVIRHARESGGRNKKALYVEFFTRKCNRRPFFVPQWWI